MIADLIRRAKERHRPNLPPKDAMRRMVSVTEIG